MNNKFLRKIIPLTLSAGAILSVPVILPQAMPTAIVAQAEAGAKAVNWDFKKDMAGWKYGGKWAYKGKPEVSQSAEFGGSIKLKVDYSPTADQNWSEVKLENTQAAAKTLDITGTNVVSYDLYYNPKNMTAGSFKTKVYAKDTAGSEVINSAPDIDLEKAKDAGNGWKVVTVKIPYQPVKSPLNYLLVSVVGSNTDYNGDIFVKNLSAHFEKLPDGYVNVNTKVKAQKTVNVSELNLPQNAGLVDAQASQRTAQVYAYMKGIADSQYLIYGHQNEMNKKVSSLAGLSDTYDITQDFSGIVGVDGLALTGNELSLTDVEKAAGVTYADKLVKLVMPAVNKGSILTMSCHMPNFADVLNKPKVNGEYDYTGYSPNVTSGEVVKRIMPGGDLNQVYIGYLDLVADFLGKLQKENVPVIFRPFHENNGSWFWWGAAYCTPSEYKNLFRYTVEYMRDKKGLHNLLYAYSPGGPIIDSADYASRYPGDAFIDITGFDSYHRDPQKDDDWMKGFDETLTAVDRFADEHNKLAAVTETGILVGNKGGALAKTDNKRPDWFNEALKTIAPHKMAYFMTWANFSEDNFDQPYLVTPKRGHQMVNEFIDFYNQPQSVFAGQIDDVSKIKVTVMPALTEYGYLTAPNAMERILKPMMLQARISGKINTVQFALKRKDGSTAAVIPAQAAGDDIVKAQISDEVLKAVGKTIGSIELVIDGKSADSIGVLYNIPAPKANPALVDDFETYYGDNGLVKAAYSTNCGSGCSVEPLLSAKHQKGDSGLEFKYNLAKGGYVGIIKSLKGVDWSAYSGVQFWITPDGKGQKLICQLNSNGEDFEVDLTNIAKETAPQLVTLPFSQFKGKNGGTFDKSAVQHFAIYCNAVGDAVSSTVYLDDIQAVK